jgi:hypothetical protein
MARRTTRNPPEDAFDAKVVPWEIEEALYGVAYRRPGDIWEDYRVGTKAAASAVASQINAKAARRGFSVFGTW